MEISGLDFLINMLSYLAGLGSGLLICCKNKDMFLIRSRSQDNLRENDIYNVTINSNKSTSTSSSSKCSSTTNENNC